MIPTKSLTEQQAAFVRHVADGVDITLAAELSGYEKSSCTSLSLRMMRQPNILANIQINIARNIALGAPAAVKLLRRFVTEETWDPRIRLHAAKTLVGLAGYVAPKASAAAVAGEKPLNELSMTELRALADKLEGELAGRAKEVSSAAVAPKTMKDLGI